MMWANVLWGEQLIQYAEQAEDWRSTVLIATRRSWRLSYKDAMQWKVTGVLLLVSVFFVFLYLPDEVLKPVSQRFGMAQEAVLRMGISFSGLLLTRWVLFAQDHLATGRSKASQFFRHCYVTSYAVDRFGLGQEEANTRWFDYFNEWRDPSHANHRYWKMNFYRSYTLRLVYSLKRILVVFGMGAGVSTVLWTWVVPMGGAPDLLAGRLVVLVATLAFVAWIHHSNQFKRNLDATSYHETYSATGAYAKFKEIAGILCTKFEADVLQESQGVSNSG